MPQPRSAASRSTDFGSVIQTLASACRVIVLLAAGSAIAEEPGTAGSPAKANGAIVKTVKTFDVDHDRKLDASELESLNRELAAAPSGPLSALDRNGDGKVDSSEVAALKLWSPGQKFPRQFDTNHDMKIEGEESTALRRAFDLETKGPLRALDQNQDSKLDDGEIADFNDRLARRAAQQQQQKSQVSRQKNGSSAGTTSATARQAAENDVGTGTATLIWTAPSKNNDGTPLKNLTGYVIRYGRTPGALTHRIVVNDPRAKEHVVEKLGPGDWYFSVATLTADGRESAPTRTVKKLVE
jgi:hypothetical protein